MNNLSPHDEVSPFAVDLAGVSKFFGPVAALDQITAQFTWGTILAVFGPNGAGKSTLLRTLATLVRPDEGTVTIAGFRQKENPNSIRRQVGYSGHQTLLYENLTVQENLEFYARLYQINDRSQTVSRTLRQFELDEYAGHRVRTLSHGMRKRCSLARAVVHRPRILLLDEPEAGLDTVGRGMLNAIVEQIREDGSLVLITSHSTEWAYKLATRLVLLESGTIVLDSTPVDMSYQDLESRLIINQVEYRE